MSGTSSGRSGREGPRRAPPLDWEAGLFDVGGHRLHARWSGRGEPTVVFEHGMGTSSKRWGRVPDAVAAFARAFVYDRAGRGLSEPGPAPRTSGVMVGELRALLAGAGIAPPYVLVGHSFGGQNARLFACLYPEDIAGLVLLDSGSANAEAHDRFMAVLPPVAREFARRPPAQKPEGIDTEASRTEVLAAGPLPDIRLVVITAGNVQAPPNWPTDWPVDEVRRVGHDIQAELARRTPQGSHAVGPRSGHYVQEDEPDLVIEAIRSVVEECRQSPR